MPLVMPFKGLRPATGREDDVVAPPYDVVNRDEAKALVEGRPWSFLHVSRPEIDLPDDVDPYDPSVYQQGAANLQKLIDENIVVRDDSPCYYVYRLTMGEHVQTGLVAAASVLAYDNDRIKKHEFTRPVKEDDRVRQIDTLNTQTGPVFLVYPATPSIDQVLAATSQQTPDIDVTAIDEVRHEIWVVSDESIVTQLSADFDALDALYVADGHHRSAAASRIAAERGTTADDGVSHNYFLSVIFPHDQMQILDYNRVVKDLNGLSESEFMAKVAERFDLQILDNAQKPSENASYSMYISGQWYQLTLQEELIPTDDPVAKLDVSLLADNLIEPVLGISDPRRDNRIDFVGGIRGMEGLEARIDGGDWAVAFACFPTAMSDLMAVADAGEVMPPKSTWFEPKLADGLVSHVLD